MESLIRTVDWTVRTFDDFFLNYTTLGHGTFLLGLQYSESLSLDSPVGGAVLRLEFEEVW